MAKEHLIASCGTITGAEEALNDYFYSTSYEINPETLEISNFKGAVTSVRCVKDKNRYRLEIVENK